MIRFTYIARVTDGLMLVASIDGAQGQEEAKNNGKQIIRTLDMRSPKQCTFESDPYAFHYLLEDNICFLVHTEKSYPKRLAFLFLSELHNRFISHLHAEHGPNWVNELATVDRPYAYIKFDKQIMQLRKEYSDPNSRQTASKLNDDLKDVTNIMKKNIDDVLKRGGHLDDAFNASRKLMDDSKDFHMGSKRLNRLAFYRKWAPVAAGSVMVLFFFYLRFFIL
mmetsp:Transcript_646/g.1959  ORF Transcript_646/g.1959 Transcript_646/m.1959 type:complete len:222 (-) Transcript_646:363-1028(-)